MPKAEALSEAKKWLRSMTANEIDSELAALERGEVRPLARGKGCSSAKGSVADQVKYVAAV